MKIMRMTVDLLNIIVLPGGYIGWEVDVYVALLL